MYLLGQDIGLATCHVLLTESESIEKNRILALCMWRAFSNEIFIHFIYVQWLCKYIRMDRG
jgi:hypothetical protein